ncbi:TonB-dependent receptor [Novosphingobium olei]|uniref:TonB-dependent receptor n=1 Tax=Novosphingobium olei TaxID=2728851 RepID=UPI00308EC635|nr:TonB-dependent receptor [Novosphingobium olei]
MAVLALALLVEPAASRAATPDGPDAAAPPGNADIIVTANKRPERKQDIAMSLWAMSAEQLDRAQVRDFDDLVKVEPSLTVTKTTQPGNNSINIRGVGTYAFSIATRASVSVVVDDVPQAFQAQAFRELADIASIEVLRGPQSTLFGSSATAGVVSITTAAPTTRLTAAMTGGFTSDGEQRANGFVSGPLAERLLFRLSASANRYRGNLRNIYTGNWVGGQSGIDLRGKLVWSASDAITITAAAHHDRAGTSCCTSAYYAVSPGVSFGNFARVRVPQGVILGNIVPGPDNRTISADVDPRGDATESGASVKMDWRLGKYALTAISGFATYALDDLQDTDGTAFNWGPGGAGVPGAARGGSANGGWFRIRSVTQELRLTSPAAERLSFVAGLFFSDTRAQRSFVRGSNSLGPYGSLAIVPPTTSAYSSYFAQARDTNIAAFGQARYDLTGRFALSAGIRFNRDAMRYRLIDRVASVSFGVPDCSSATPSGLAISTCDTFNAVAGRVALEFRPSPAFLVFAGYDRGYKGAAYDLSSTYTTRTPVTQAGPYSGFPVADAVAAKQPIRPETVDAFQLGWKSRPASGLTWNVTFYLEMFHGFQAQSRDELTRQNILNSIERVTTKGVEMEVAAELSPDFSVHGYGTWNDARIGAFPNATCYSSQTAARGCINGQQDLAGKSLPNAPRWKFSLSAEREIRLRAETGLRLTANWVWQSRVVQSLLQDPNSVQRAYGLLGLGAELHDGRRRLRIYCSNLFDQNYALNRGRDGNWNINPYGATSAPISDATKWTPGRDSSRYVRVEFASSF